MSNLTRSIFDSLLPPGSIWTVEENADFDLLLEGIADNLEIIRLYLSQLSDLRNPNNTFVLDDLEREYGVKNIGLSETVRRQNLSVIVFGKNSSGAEDFLQQILNDAGFNVFVYQNNPAVDPAIYLTEDFQMVANGDNAFAGREDAFAGILGGELLVNGDLLQNQGPEYLSVADAPTMVAGNQEAFAGRFNEIILTPVNYAIPINPNAWPFVFFVSGEKINNLYTGAFQDMTYGNFTYILIGTAAEIQTSSDGETWERKIADNLYTADFRGITFGNGIFLIIGNGGEIQTSPDNGQTWTHQNAAEGITTDLISTVFGNSIFIIVGENGVIQTSSDGEAWIPRVADGSYTGQFNSITNNGSLFVTVGDNGEIQTSSDGGAWVHRTPAGGYTGDFFACTNNGSLFVIAGENGEIQTSPDGVTWTARTPAGGYVDNFTGATSGNNIFVLVGENGEIQTSSDGITWSVQEPEFPFTGNLFAAGFGDNKFLIGGILGEIQLSLNAFTWFHEIPDFASFTLSRGEVSSEREQEFKRLILKIKPLYTWAALIITYI